MATTYKTPGVYIEEISKFPPSVAQVETAIPAFIGYTEKATKKIDGDLNMDPTRITSLVEYETYFGSAQKETGISVNIDDVLVNGEIERTITVPEPASRSSFLMYYSMVMYFANGGGPCYILSVNTYKQNDGTENTIDFDELNDGLNLLEKEDEPTLILFPDARSLSEANFYSLYNNALTQCNTLQDRFTIIDTLSDDESLDPTPVEALRDGINLEKDYLKYGAVYYPYLETILNYDYDPSTVTINHTTEQSPLYTELESANGSLDEANDTLANIADLVEAFTEENVNFTAMPAAEALVAKNQAMDAIQPSVDALNLVIENGNEVVTITSNAATTSADEDVVISEAATTSSGNLTTSLGGDIQTMVTNLETHINNIETTTSGATVKSEINNAVATVGTIEAVIQGVIDFIDAAIIAIENAVGVDTTGSMNGSTLDAIENSDSEVYNTIISEIKKVYVELPPSSSMAGVYARVDEDRGVWKAPANVGLNYVIKPTVKITHEDQKSLNVDTTAGKSINAIRSFTGKGTLVWGARTLAGNDNEWRYISVRRFFNMVEESVKKASAQFVFEPNDANTWVKVRAMIENFLTLQWRAGALAGAKQDEAFYVKVGLGQTMTAQDILNGNMIIEIGMAAVRPAEFIILRFSHKMQES